MTENIRRPIGDEDGQAMAEYALILGLIAAVCIIALTAFGVAVSGFYQPLIDFLGAS